MKKFYVTVAAALTLCVALPLGLNAQNVVPNHAVMTGGVGPVISGSADAASLPSEATRFINGLDARVVSCEREFSSGEYDVKLDTGIEVEFNSQGKVIEIEAPDNAVLGSALVKSVVPHKVYDSLKEMKIDNAVVSVSQHGRGYKVDIVSAGPFNELLFNHDGELIARYMD